MDGRRLLLPISLLTSQLIAYNLKEIRAFHTNPPNFPQTWTRDVWNDTCPVDQDYTAIWMFPEKNATNLKC